MNDQAWVNHAGVVDAAAWRDAIVAAWRDAEASPGAGPPVGPAGPVGPPGAKPGAFPAEGRRGGGFDFESLAGWVVALAFLLWFWRGAAWLAVRLLGFGPGPGEGVGH